MPLIFPTVPFGRPEVVDCLVLSMDRYPQGFSPLSLLRSATELIWQ